MNIYNQARTFGIFFCLGIAIAFLFDIFKVLRKKFKQPDFLVNLEDIVFLLLSGGSFFKFLIYFNEGSIRFYIIIAIFFGIVIFALTFSKPCDIIILVVLNAITLLVQIILKILRSPYYFAKLVFKNSKISNKQNSKNKIVFKRKTKKDNDNKILN
jgi:spore cortex biosynthesis protein YabQ